MGKTTAWAAALFLGALATTQQPAPAVRARDGEIASFGRWYCEGGNAARNGSSLDAPILRRPTIAWTQKLSGMLIGEPLVWDQFVVVALKIGDKKRSLEVRRLADGSLAGPPRTMDSQADPCPSLWDNEILWRSNPDGLEVLRIGKKGAEFVARTPTTKGIGAPLRFGTRVFVIADGQVVCLRVSDFRELWRSSERGFAGTLTLLDRCVYAMQATTDGWALTALDREFGAKVASGVSIGLKRPPGDDARLHVAGDRGILRFGRGHMLRDFEMPGAELNALRIRVPLAVTEPEIHGVPLAHALDATLQFGMLAMPEGVQLYSLAADGKTGIRLDNCDLHRRLAAIPPTLVRGVVYFGACAVDTTEFRLLWRLERNGDRPLPDVRAIPAGRTLLLGSGNELTALRESTVPDPVAAELDAAWTTAQRTRLSPFVDTAMTSGDLELASELLGRCRGLGADEAWATKKEKEIAARAKDPKLKVDATKAAAVRSDAELTPRATLDELHRGLGSWTTRPATDRRLALRFLLERAPDHGGCVADVRGMLPKDLAAPEPFFARDWLDFLDAISLTPVTFLDAKVEEFAQKGLDPIAAQNKQQLLEWRHKWRPDLQALLSKRMLLFSPISTPGSLAKALATAELVGSVLEGMFANSKPVRNDPRPMLVFIYGDRDDYLKESDKIGVSAAEWAAGYYSDAWNELVPKSRLYVPKDDVGFASVLPTLAHELTHQWLMDRCPAFVPDPAAIRMGPRGFWIVEGFASLVGQFEFDFVRQSASLGTSNLEDADLVVSATGKQLIDWQRLVKMSQIDFARMSQSVRETAIVSTMRMGIAHRARPLTMFYAQSAMLCRYLYEAEEGRFRAKLLDFVAAYYTGRSNEQDFAAWFGVDAAELGPKVVEFSRRLNS